MKITDNIGVGAAAGIRKKRTNSPDGGDFDAFLDSIDTEDKQAGAAASVNAPSMLDSLFAVQQIENNYQRSKESIERGKQILDFLDEIRAGMLSGEITKAKIQQLRSSVNSNRGWVMDQKLGQILDEIETRAEVELAKLENQQRDR